jgi:GrpB-like predicted nucleotidyltransferase (UPF0157 family)
LTDATLARYDPDWPKRFRAEVRVLRAALQSAIEIAHVGSTSVPGLAAKPTIDIAVGVPDLSLDEATHRRMTEAGYSYGGDHGQPQHIFRKGKTLPREVLVHVVEHGGQMWQDFLRLRDYLRANPAEAGRYAEFKASLLVGRGGWYRGIDKSPFIEPILGRGA